MERYRIVIDGHIDPSRWSEWFSGMVITPLDNGMCGLTGDIVDPAALHGILGRIRDMGLPLVSVTRLDD